jgi:hypothetical protein
VITAALVLLQIVTALPTSKVLWDVEATDTPTHFEVRYNTGAWVPVGLPLLADGPLRTYGVSLPALVTGQHVVEVRACDAVSCSASGSALFLVEDPAPLCTDIPSVFITRWEMTTGKPGSRMRVNYQLASISPIVEVLAKVDGAMVAVSRGTDLRDTAGLWFVTPPAGIHTLQVFVKNSAGCTKEVFSPVGLIVK